MHNMSSLKVRSRLISAEILQNKFILLKNLLEMPRFAKQFVLLIFLLGAMTALSFGQGTQTYISGSGNFTVPAGVTSITVQCWGAGGGGGGSSTSGQGGSGGGGGGYTTITYTVTPGQLLAYSVGTGGAAGAAGAAAAGTGGNTTFSTLAANGGTGGAGNRGTAGAGGSASGGSTNTSGSNGTLGTTTGGAGGAGANGGAGGTGSTNAAGGTGTPPGGGGGGGEDAGGGGGDRAGGAGAAGQIIITWTQPVFYSQGTGNLATLSNWNTSRTGGGYSPTDLTGNYQTFVIQNSHTITSAATLTLGTNSIIEIENGGTLTESNAITMAASGTLQVDNGGTLNHNVNSITIFAGTESFGATSTVNYGLNNNQSVISATYGNLTTSGGAGTKTAAGILTINGNITIGNGTTFAASTFSHSVTGNWTNNGTFTTGAGSTVNFNGTTAQSIGGTASTSFVNLTVSNTTAAIGVNVNTNVSGTLNMNGANTLLTPDAGVIFNNAAAAGTITGTGTVQVTRTAATAGFSNQYRFTTNTLTNLTVEYTVLTGGQTISALTYGNLTLDNTSGTNTAAGNVTVGKAFTIGSGGTFSTASNLNLNGTTTCSGTISATAGTVTYAATALNVLTGTYYGLTFSGGVGYTICNAITVNNALTFSAAGATLNTAFDVTLNNATFTNPTNGTISASASTVYYSYAGAQNILPGTYYNMDIYDGNFTKTLQGAVTINNNLAWDLGNIALSTFNLTLASTANITSSNVFSNTHMIVCNGAGTTGSFIRQSNSTALLTTTYPLGTGTSYSPIAITTLSGTVTSPASITLSVVPTYFSAGGAGASDLNRYWNVTTSNLTVTDANVTFSYVDADVAGTESSYQGSVYSGSTWTYFGSVNTSGNTFTSGSTVILSGVWTARRPATTFYSYQSGVWSNATTWTLDPSGTIYNNPSSATPSSTDNVVILNGRTVTVTNNNNTVFQLEIQEGSILDLTNSNTQNYGTIYGKGRMRSTRGTLPAGNYTLFTQSGGGTIELYGNITAAPELSISTFNNLEMNGDAGQSLYIVNTPTQVNGNILIKGGGLYINHNGATPLSVTVEGNITIKTGCTFSLGTGGANHNLYIKGDLENEGTVKLTSANAPTYDSDPAASVSLTFNNTTKDQSLSCNGPTTLHRLIVDKGTDDTYILNVNTNISTNFLLYGRNDQDATGTDSPGSVVNNKALEVYAGTLYLGSNITIPRLLTANGISRYYTIDQDATIIMDGSNVAVTAETNFSSIVVYGKLKILGSSTFTSTGTQGIILRIYGVFDVEGSASAPTITTTAFRTSSRLELGTHRGTFIMNGGILNISGNNYADTHPAFALPFGDNTFQMSDGTINITNSTYYDGGQATNWSWLVSANKSNISVTGGTVNINATARNAYINSTAPFYNLNFTGNATYTNEIQSITDQYDGGNLVVPAAPLRELVVLHDLNIGAAATFITNDQNVTVGGNFTINSTVGSTYTPGGNNTTFNGYSLQNFTNAGTITNGLYNLTLTNSSILSITNYLTIRNNLIIGSENTLRDEGHTINVAGNITNNGTHESVTGGSLILNGTLDQYINGNGEGVFGNLSLNKATGSTFQSANISITGNLRLANTAALLDIGSNMLTLSATSFIYDALAANTNTNFSATRMIQTDGIQSDLGIQRTYASTGITVFPVGASGKFTPARIEIDATPSGGWGTITINPVNSIHPLATTPNTLKYYWNVRRSNMSGFTAGDIRLYFYYQTADIVGDETKYVNSFYYPIVWTYGTESKVTDATNEILFDAIDQPRGHYTAGEPGTVSVQTYYSNTANGNWDTFDGTYYTSWTNDPLLNTPATTLPNQSSPVVIRSGHTINVTSNSKLVGSLIIEDNAVLDLTTTTGHFFGLIYQSTIEGTGKLRISSATANAEFPGGDFGEFLGTNGGVVEYYTTGAQDFTVPSGSVTSSTLLNESFEGTFPPTSWTRYNLDGGGSQWNRSTTYANTGSASAAHTYSIAGNQNGMLVTPALNMSGAGSYELTFYRYNDYPTDYVYQGIWISTSTNASSAFTELAELGQGASGWQKHTIDLSSYAGNSNVYIAFVYKGFNADDVYIDDVIVTKNVGNSIYHNLISNPGTSRTITLPGIDVNVSGYFTVKGNGITATSSSLANTLTIEGKTSIDETAILRIDNTKTQTFVLNDTLSVGNGASVMLNTAGTTALAHKINLYGDVINNGIINLNPGSNKYADLYFLGANNRTFSGAGTTTNLNRVYVNKGTSQTPIINVTSNSFTLNSALSQALTISNGTIRFTGSSLDLDLSTTSSFTIPSTGCLSVNGSTVTVGSSATDAADIYLSGKLEVISGTMNVGASANTNNNDIEYGTAGTPEISVSGGTLNVNGQIRRSTTIATGNLTYRQSGGSVYIYGKSRQTSRALLEVLNTGSFYSSGGDLYLVDGVATGVSTVFGELDLEPATYSVTGGTIHLGTSDTDPTTNFFNLYLGGPIWSLAVNGETNPKVAFLRTFPATINGNLTIGTASGAASYFNTAGLNVNIGGNFANYSTSATNGYVYNNTTQVTRFFGVAATQNVISSGSILTRFGTVEIDNSQSSGRVVFSGSVYFRLYGDLKILNGTLATDNQYIQLLANVTNNSIHESVGTGYLYFSTATNQYISGTDNAVFGKIRIATNKAVITYTSFKINTNLTLEANAKLSIGDKLLTFGSSATLTGITPTAFVVCNGALSDLGVRREYTAAGGSFIFPIGVGSEGGKYTPAAINVTNTGGASGTITVKPVDAPHPMRTNTIDDELQYFWSVSSTGFGATPIVTHTYTYSDLDILGTEATYVNARLYNFTWTKQTEVVDFAGNQIKFTDVNYINGDYTAGEVTNWGTVHKYYSAGTGNWSNAGSWLLDSPTGPGAATPPNGNPVFIQAGHTITTNQDGAYAGSVDIASTATLDLGSKTGHNMGYITGSGTIHIDATGGGSFVFPGGDPSSFMNTTGSTVHFSGAGTIPSNITTYQNILFSGNNTKTIPATDITVLGNLTISAGNLDNNINNRTITLYGNWSSSVSGGYISGTGKVILAGGNAQNITSTGGENFYNFQLNKTAGTVATLGSVVNINRLFSLTSGIINTESNLLTMTWDDSNALTGGSTTAYIDGPLRKLVRNSGTFTFPVGDASRYGPVYISGVTSSGNQYWTGRYYNVAPSNQASLTSPLQLVSNNEYWEMTGVAGTSANVRIRWDSQSQIIPATALARQKLRVAEYQTSTSKWSKVGQTIVDGGQTSGTVGTSIPVSFTGVAKQYTIGIEQTASAQITGTSVGVCNDGTLMPVTFVIAGDAPLKLTYQINGVNVTPSLEDLGEGTRIVNFSYDQLYAISGVGNYVITVGEILDKNGNSGVILAGSATLTLYATPNPIISSGATTVMISTSSDYTVSYSPTNTYAWTVASTTGSASASLTYADSSKVTATWGPGTGTVTLQLVESTPAPNSCSKTITYLVTVRDWPVIVGNFSVCASSTEEYHSKQVAGHTYIWTVVGGAIQSGAGTYSITVLWSTETAGTITLNQGPIAPYTEVTQNVTINTSPTATLNVSGASSICDGENVTLLLSRSGAGIAYTYYLQKDGVDYMTFDQSTASANPYSYATENLVWSGGTYSTTYSYRLRIVNNTTGCSSIWDEEIITVYKIPETGDTYHISNTIGY